MKQYDSYRYYFPPRPETKSTPNNIDLYERMGFIGQPKLNGSCGMLYTNPHELHFMNRHQQAFSRNIIPRSDLEKMHRGNGWQVLCGEYMDKSKKDSNGNIFVGFVIFDIIVHNGQYLNGTTFIERSNLLDNLFESKNYDGYIDNISTNVYRVKNFRTNLSKVWNEITKIDMYEGEVFKKENGILEIGYRPENNTGWQLKVRKPTKNYNY